VSSSHDSAEGKATAFADGLAARRPGRGPAGVLFKPGAPALRAREAGLGRLGEGSVLAPDARSFFEPRLGLDLGGVRIHTGEAAHAAAAKLGARAFALGQDIVFGDSEFAPSTGRGRWLLAHELAHVDQQARGQTAQVQRQLGPIEGPDPADDPRLYPPGAPSAKKCGRPAHCPPGFCDPYPSAGYAIAQRTKLMPILLAGIAAFVDSRVVPLWRDHLLGGTPPRNLTATFGADFARSLTTAETTDRLENALRSRLTSSPPVFPSGSASVTLPLSGLISAEIAQLDNPASPNRMNFNHPSDIAGNIAGDIGKDQLACQAGAMPSPFNDERHAEGSVTIARDAAGNLTVATTIHYTVRDTIDLCPGDCGTNLEQVATVPISQFEATGISGDVPFTVEFTVTPPPFTIPAPAAAPASPAPGSSAAPPAPGGSPAPAPAGPAPAPAPSAAAPAPSSSR
jgi:hypothetical protein